MHNTPGFYSMTSIKLGKATKPAFLIPDNVKVSEVIDQLAIRATEVGRDDPFYVLDLEGIVRLYDLWRRLLPRVEIFYAVKTNDQMPVLQTLATLGTGFDCASKEEIERILNLGVPPERIIYAHPCKQRSHLQSALQLNITMMTFDNEVELHKMKSIANQTNTKVEAILRIFAMDSTARWHMGRKFGCTVQEGKRLLRLAKDLDIDVIGVCFHVGSGCKSPVVYETAIHDAKELFDYSLSECGKEMSLLDLGGGFAGNPALLEEFAVHINKALDQDFPTPSKVRIVAEPGRYFAMSPYTLCTNVIARRILPDESSAPMYYVNDSKYGSLTFYPLEGPGHVRVAPRKLPNDLSEQAKENASVWGHTCSGLDVIVEEIPLPRLEIGDWLIWRDTGAYSLSNSSRFNGFHKPKVLLLTTSRYIQRMESVAFK